MEYLTTKSNMLELNSTQTKILKIMLDIQMERENSKKGITSYTIRNQGIPGRTFSLNKDVLLYNQIIRIIKEEKTGKQRRVYYELTPIGYFGLLKSLSNNNQKDFKKYVKFIPHIGAKWEKYNKILKQYHFVLPLLLKRAIDEVNITLQFRFHSKDGKIRPRIDETTHLIFENYGLDLRISQLYYPADEEKKRGIHINTFLNNNEKIWRNLFSKESIEISEHMINRLIFLFYFNSIKMGYDDRFGFHIFNNFHFSEFDKLKLEVPKTKDEAQDYKKVIQEKKKIWEKFKKFQKTTRTEFLKITYKDIFEDEDLFFLFIENFNAVSNVFIKPPMIQELEENITKKMIKEGLEKGIIKMEKIKDSDSESEN